MTYEERVKRVRELAGDYNSIIANFDLEKVLYNNIRNTANKSLQQLIGSLSLGDIHILTDSDGHLAVTKDNWEVEECLYRYKLLDSGYMGGDAEKIFRDTLEELLLRLITNIARSKKYKVSDIARLASYASLIMANVDIDAARTFKKITDEFKQAKERFDAKRAQYDSYRSTLSSELYSLSREWYLEKAVFVPGMKIGINNFKTGETVVRTIKKCKFTDDLGHCSITFNESSTTVTDPSRISMGVTWFLNNGECSDIAKAIKWSFIANFI